MPISWTQSNLLMPTWGRSQGCIGMLLCKWRSTDSLPTPTSAGQHWSCSTSTSYIHWLSLANLELKVTLASRSCSLVAHTSKCGHVINYRRSIPNRIRKATDATLLCEKPISVRGRFWARGVHSLLYFAYTCVRDLFIGGELYPCKKNYKVMVFYM